MTPSGTGQEAPSLRAPVSLTLGLGVGVKSFCLADFGCWPLTSM